MCLGKIIHNSKTKLNYLLTRVELWPFPENFTVCLPEYLLFYYIIKSHHQQNAKQNRLLYQEEEIEVCNHSQ